MRHGDSKTLESEKLARSLPLHAQEILADSETICKKRWSKTKCRVQVKQCTTVKDLSHKLCRVDDLSNIQVSDEESARRANAYTSP